MTHRLLLAAAAAGPFAVLCAAAPAMAQAQNPWTGFYVGANLGGAWGDTSSSTHVAPGSGPVVIPGVDAAALNGAGTDNSRGSGFTGGLEGGYNYVADGMLFGIETDWGAMDVAESRSKTVNSALLIAPPLSYTLDQNLHTDWIWTLRPRFGFVGSNWLAYATLGLAVTDIKSTMNYSDTHAPARNASLSISDTKSGWVGGLGGAYAFAPQWSVKGEWLYADFGNVNGSASTPDGFVTFTSDASVKTNLFRLGLDYRF